MTEYLFPTPLFEGLRITRLVNTDRETATVSYHAGGGLYHEETILPEHTCGSVRIGYGTQSRVMVIFERPLKPGEMGAGDNV